MKTSFYENPHYDSLNKRISRSLLFLKESYDYYRHKIEVIHIFHEELRSFNPKENIDLIQKLYFEGRLKKNLLYSFSEYSNFLQNKKKRAKFYFTRVTCPFRGHSKYVKSNKHKKKNLTPKQLNKKEWRKYKKVKKDKSKKHHKDPYKTYLKKISIKKFRSWERDQIKKENWDDLKNIKKHKELVNYWMYY